jgi:hypothetical protein
MKKEIKASFGNGEGMLQKRIFEIIESSGISESDFIKRRK